MAFASKEWVMDLVNKCLKKAYIKKENATQIANVVYVEDKPVSQKNGTSSLSVYINANSGSDTEGNGSSAKPFKTWAFAASRIPKDGRISIIFEGDFRTQGYLNLVDFSGHLHLYFTNNPQFYGIGFYGCVYVTLQTGNFSCNISDNTSMYRAAMDVSEGTTLFCNAGTYSITGNTSSSYYTRGLHVGYGSTVIGPSWASGRFQFYNCWDGIEMDGCSNASIYGASFSGCHYNASSISSDSKFYSV